MDDQLWLVDSDVCIFQDKHLLTPAAMERPHLIYSIPLHAEHPHQYSMASMLNEARSDSSETHVEMLTYMILKLCKEVFDKRLRPPSTDNLPREAKYLLTDSAPQVGSYLLLYTGEKCLLKNPVVSWELRINWFTKHQWMLPNQHLIPSAEIRNSPAILVHAMAMHSPMLSRPNDKPISKKIPLMLHGRYHAIYILLK